MSICLTWFPISGLGKPKLYQNMLCFTRIGDFTWRVSDFWRHLRKHLGRNASNYFKYHMGGACALTLGLSNEPSLNPIPPVHAAPASQPDQCIGPHQ